MSPAVTLRGYYVLTVGELIVPVSTMKCFPFPLLPWTPHNTSKPEDKINDSMLKVHFNYLQRL